LNSKWRQSTLAAVPSPSRSPDGADRPSLRAIAQAAGVSAMTVSRALRNHPNLAALTKARVQKIARDLGYRPDPLVAKLMHHLRIRRKPAFQSSICALTNVPLDALRVFSRAVVAEARRRAEARGYAFSVAHFDSIPGAPGALQRILRSRGVEGVLLLPMKQTDKFASLLDWREFSVVAATTSAITPEVHRVTPNHFRNMQVLCAELTSLGCRRIGVVLPEEYAQRVYHAFNAAALWHAVWQGSESVAPLIHQGARPVRLREWFARERPDAIVGSNQENCRAMARALGLRIPGRVAFAATNVSRADPGFSGIDERPADIGATAVDILTAMIHRGEKGLPEVPMSTEVLGRWIQGRSCLRRSNPAAPIDQTGRGQARMIFYSE
jgi:DNA-binding LacI/PurR family transcriptional regulator